MEYLISGTASFFIQGGVIIVALVLFELSRKE